MENNFHYCLQNLGEIVTNFENVFENSSRLVPLGTEKIWRVCKSFLQKVDFEINSY